MKIAYLISVYKDPSLLYRMIKALKSEDSFFFVHVDAKVDINIFTSLFCHSDNVTFTTNRYYIQWGGWNQVCYQKELLRECIMSGILFDRVFILTGQDYPLLSNLKIRDILIKYPKKEYIKGLNISLMAFQKRIHNRIVLYHFFRDLRIPYKIKQVFSFGSRMLMTFLPIRKKTYVEINGKHYDVYLSSSYMCLTYDCSRFVYQEICKNKQLIKYFRWSFVPEEMVIPTIIFNSKYKEWATIIDGGYCGLKNLSSITYFNYDKAIQVFTEKDYQELKNSNMMFARKMQSGISDILMDLIDKARNETCSM